MATMDVEVFECQRYRLFAEGWSSKYLLPTDRNAFRVRGCTKSWKTLAEASAALLAPGWSWEQTQGDHDSLLQPIEWVPDLQGEDMDADGWSYCSGFPLNFEGGAAKTSINRVVRWRRLVRTQTFSGIDALVACVNAAAKERRASGTPRSQNGGDATPIVGLAVDAPLVVPPPCPHVELEGAAHVEKQLADAISLASFYGEWSSHALAVLKGQLLGHLACGAAGGKGNKVVTLEAALKSFVDSKRSVGMRMTEAISGRGQDEAAVVARLQEVAASFPAAELEAFAVLAIWRFRPDLACSAQECASRESCGLRAVYCPSPGCDVRCCAQALPAHDELCPHKLVPCGKCGEEVPRCKMSSHLLAACPERAATCIFGALGCEAPLKHRNLESHLEECSQAHMMLLLRSLLEHQDEARTMGAKLSDLETQFAQSKAEKDAVVQKYGGLEKKVVGLETQISAAEKKASQDVKKAAAPVEDLRKKLATATEDTKKRVDAVEKDAKRRVESLEKSHEAEMALLREEVVVLKESVGGVAKMRVEVGALKKGLEVAAAAAAAAAAQRSAESEVKAEESAGSGGAEPETKVALVSESEAKASVESDTKVQN